MTEERQTGHVRAVYHHPPRAYSNLWGIRLDPEGRCAEFTEWWMQHPDP